MQASIGDGVEPTLQLLVQVVEIAEAAGQEEVLADIAEWSLDFALGFGAIRPDRGPSRRCRRHHRRAHESRALHGAQIGKGRDPFAQIVDKRRDLVWPPRLPRAIGGEFEPALDVFSDCLGIAPRSPGDRVTDRP